MASEHASEAVARIGELLFGNEWGAPMSRLTDINQRTLLRVKVAAAEGREYPAARAALAELVSGLEKVAGLAVAEAEHLGVTKGKPADA